MIKMHNNSLYNNNKIININKISNINNNFNSKIIIISNTN